MHAHKSRLGPTETLEALVALERRARDATNLTRRTTAAALGTFKPRDHFDWAHPRKIDRALVERLLELDFVDRANNVLLRGPSGVGKTLFAKHLGQAALERGYTVRFCTLAAALMRVFISSGDGSTEQHEPRHRAGRPAKGSLIA